MIRRFTSLVGFPPLKTMASTSSCSFHCPLSFPKNSTFIYYHKVFVRKLQLKILSISASTYTIPSLNNYWPATLCLFSFSYDGSNDVWVVEKFNTQTNAWLQVSSMGTRRSCLGVVTCNGLIYAVGGYDGASCLNTAERYDPLTDTWTSIGAMTIKRRYVKLAVVGESFVGKIILRSFESRVWL